MKLKYEEDVETKDGIVVGKMCMCDCVVCLSRGIVLTTLFLHCVDVVSCPVLSGCIYVVICRLQENLVKQTTTLCR